MKYLSFIKFKFLTSLQFRAEIVIWTLLDFLPFFLLFFVFQSIFAEQGTIRGLTLEQTLEYYFVAAIIQGLTAVHFESWRAEEIRLGKIDFYFIRPFSYLKEIIFTDVAGKLFYLFLFAPLYFIFFHLIQNTFHVSLFQSLSLVKLLSFLILLVFAYMLQMLLGLFITILTFWFEGAEGLQHFKWLLTTLLAGAIAPIQFLPTWLAQIVNALPLKYLYLVPIQVFQGLAKINMSDILYLTITVITFSISIKLLLSQGIKKYSSTGG